MIAERDTNDRNLAESFDSVIHGAAPVVLASDFVVDIAIRLPDGRIQKMIPQAPASLPILPMGEITFWTPPDAVPVDEPQSLFDFPVAPPSPDELDRRIDSY